MFCHNDGMYYFEKIPYEEAGLKLPVLAERQEVNQHDILIFNFTDLGNAAMRHVFFYPDDIEIENLSKFGSEEMPYHKGFQEAISEYDLNEDSLEANSWGTFSSIRISEKTVLLFSPSIAFKFNPSLTFHMINLLLDEVRPNLVLMQNTAGGTNKTHYLGDVVLANSSTYLLKDELGEAYYNHKTYGSFYSPDPEVFGNIEEFFLRPPTNQNYMARLANKFYLPQEEVLLMQDIPRYPHPKLHTNLDNPQLTTNYFLTGESSGIYAEYAGVSEDAAPIFQHCQERNIDALAFSPISDPWMNQYLTIYQQRNVADSLYEHNALYVLINSSRAILKFLSN